VDRAIERAARIGDAWPITFYPSFTLLVDQMKVYRSALASAAKPVPDDMPILRECYVAPTMSEALRESEVTLMAKYARYHAWGQDSFLPEKERFDQPFEQFTRDRFLIGDPGFVSEEILRYHESLGVDHFILRMQWPGLEQERVLRTIRLLADRVVPQLAAVTRTTS
jgi:alkanesulfonate monooxygenase SsuD/methylene tetrahydromethanopterin reductase-like flavin-dependent oxidoreductase (luciferase family)